MRLHEVTYMSLATATQPSAQSLVTCDQHDQLLSRRMAERRQRVTSKEPKLMSSFYLEQEAVGATMPQSR